MSLVKKEEQTIYLHQNIRFLRKQLKLSQEELAKRVGLTVGVEQLWPLLLLPAALVVVAAVVFVAAALVLAIQLITPSPIVVSVRIARHSSSVRVTGKSPCAARAPRPRPCEVQLCCDRSPAPAAPPPMIKISQDFGNVKDRPSSTLPFLLWYVSELSSGYSKIFDDFTGLMLYNHQIGARLKPGRINSKGSSPRAI